ncbi:germin-like protein subfamily 1 member 17 [Amaranthus tricolor]|uniref:germin-like protein subfamily 1 member 17 n=1 Tax=Amaranthus tricolor TaxID=29722 RepID=UPI002582FB3A|nr:germin-like protein subfamily 1 member 17 [Amaranthus tricolor]XP_057548552.1 germin-like protein subfamily 1 member 17 [Amaranthus tricolor]
MSINCNCEILSYIALFALAFYVAHATDPTQLQDFCVGTNDPNNALFVNGLFCKNPMDATPEDFFKDGAFAKPGDTGVSKTGANVTLVSSVQLAGLNTLGISLARIDFAPYGGLNPPHTHPRATEVLTVIEGTLYVGFVTSNLANGGNKFFAKVLNKGDVFVFPQGLIHFQINIGKYPAVAFAGLSSQNPGTVTIANAVFGAQPPISVDVLSKAFKLDANIVKHLQAQFWD